MQEQEIKDIQIKKKKVKLSLFADHIIVYIAKLKYYTKNRELIKKFSQVAEYQINIKISRSTFKCQEQAI